MAEPHRFEKKVHPLGWGDKELAWMISVTPVNKKGELSNMTALYRYMGYKGRNIPQTFKDRVTALLDGEGRQG